ncbi:hypothetical protein ANASTE_00611 [Anaerofustis stercorihominis DSM 17244]|uniref:Uncharacterized protein n=1 Tax=Anaerofustis stercorihominis DSM 17244 TaxID=445971 RepID=B1C7A9_9FIRM|nr:hypothetical protein ANASTE_00611 [Anaerofustis stercorihominis DSM 17244]
MFSFSTIFTFIVEFHNPFIKKFIKSQFKIRKTRGLKSILFSYYIT